MEKDLQLLIHMLDMNHMEEFADLDTFRTDFILHLTSKWRKPLLESKSAVSFSQSSRISIKSNQTLQLHLENNGYPLKVMYATLIPEHHEYTGMLTPYIFPVTLKGRLEFLLYSSRWIPIGSFKSWIYVRLEYGLFVAEVTLQCEEAGNVLSGKAQSFVPKSVRNIPKIPIESMFSCNWCPPFPQKELQIYSEKTKCVEAFESAFQHLPVNCGNSFGDYCYQMYKALIQERRVQLERYERYTLFEASFQFIRNIPKTYALTVPGLLEMAPPIETASRVVIREHGRPFAGIDGAVVHLIRTREVLHITVNPSVCLHRGTKYIVQFVLDDEPFYIMMNAVRKRLFSGIALPRPSFVNPTLVYPIANDLDSVQRSVVHSILQKDHRPFILQGSPGTGKTKLVIEAITLLSRFESAKILCCAPSDEATDLLARRLLQRKVDPSLIVYLNSPLRSLDSIDAKLFTICHFDSENRFLQFPQLNVYSKARIIISNCKNVHYIPNTVPITHTFFDEAAQASPPEAFVALSFFHSHWVLSGDIYQLGPSFRTKQLRKSLFHYFKDKPFVLTAELLKNYRSGSGLLSLSNELFYGSRMQFLDSQPVSLPLSILNDGTFPLIFHGIRGTDIDTEDSCRNPMEADRVVSVVQELLQFFGTSQVAVIGAFRDQIRLIRRKLRDIQLGTVNVGGILDFQGSEMNVVVISTVRSSIDRIQRDRSMGLGLLGTPERFNVAISRAKLMLVVVGNPDALQWDEYWSLAMKMSVRRGNWKGDAYPKRLFDELLHSETEVERKMRLQGDLTEIAQIEGEIGLFRNS